MDNAEELIKEKIERLENAVEVKEPDRVPIGIATTYFPADYANFTYNDVCGIII